MRVLNLRNLQLTFDVMIYGSSLMVAGDKLDISKQRTQEIVWRVLIALNDYHPYIEGVDINRRTKQISIDLKEFRKKYQHQIHDALMKELGHVERERSQIISAK